MNVIRTEDMAETFMIIGNEEYSIAAAQAKLNSLSSADKLKNVLFIMIDDLKPMIGAYGYSDVVNTISNSSDITSLKTLRCKCLILFSRINSFILAFQF